MLYFPTTDLDSISADLDPTTTDLKPSPTHYNVVTDDLFGENGHFGKYEFRLLFPSVKRYLQELIDIGILHTGQIVAKEYLLTEQGTVT